MRDRITLFTVSLSEYSGMSNAVFKEEYSLRTGTLLSSHRNPTRVCHLQYETMPSGLHSV
jgi:hypothetical protein